MTEGTTKFRVTLLVLCNALILAIASPVYTPQFLSGGTGRNIRHLPCVSRRTGETGVCMFAFTCAKANGTHLGTCIERFYFGSCCKIDKEPDIFPHDNTIEDGPVKPFLTNHGSIDSNNIPDYFSKPITTKPPVKYTEIPVKTTQLSTTTEKPVKVAEKPLLATTSAPVSKPVKVTLNSTNKFTTTKPLPESTTDFVGLSTFQSVQSNPSKTPSTTASTPVITTTKSSQKISPTVPSTTNSRPRPSNNKPTTSIVDSNKKPTTTSSTIKGDVKPTNKPSVNKPSNVKPSSPTQSGRPTTTTTTTTNRVRTTTAKPILTTTRRPSIPTRFPPRNATTTTTTTSRPTRPSPNRRPTPPTATTKKPTTAPIKRITTTTTTTPATTVHKRPVESVTVSSRPSSTVTGIKNVTVQVTKPSTSSGGYKPASPGQRPSVANNKPTASTTTVVNRQTTRQPPTLSTKPITTPETPSVVVNLSRPTLTTSKPFVTKPKPITTQKYETSTTKVPSRRPIPTTTIATTTTTTITPPTRKPVTSSPRPSPSTSTSMPSLITSIISNEVISPEDTTNKIQNFDTSKVESTSSSPGLVTWTSNSDDISTRAPVIATSTSQPEEPTNTEWTPITTPDGWILIHSPAPNEPDNNEDDPIRPTAKPTVQSSTSGKPVTVSSSTTERFTERPSLPTVAAATPSTTDNYVPTAEFNMSDYKQVCGRRLFPESRIVGGARSSFGKWPWQISLRQWRTSTYLHKCGAALLNENWAITAAHCVENVPPSDLLLRLGEHDLASEDEPYGFQERRVQIVASHPQFDPRTFEYDLALLRFYEPLLPFQPNTLPICLPDDDATYVGLTAHVTGWGRLYEDGPLPSVLQEVPVPVINNTVCESMYRSAGYIEHIPKIFICAGWRKGGFDSCEGDSGGPLVIQRPRDKRWILAGIISWGIGCAEPNQPGVYTRISEFREWINQILQF